MISELLLFNTNEKELKASEEEIQTELGLYEKSIDENTHSPTVEGLENWREKITPHPFASAIAEYCRLFGVDRICEIGAGAGNIVKYVKNLNPRSEVTAVENNKVHFQLLEDNICNTPYVLEPKVKNDITLLNESGHDLSSIKDGSFDMVFTCCTLMHTPFIPQLKIITEAARVSSNFVMHIENTRSFIHMGELDEELNNHVADYAKVYEKLGFRTVLNETSPYPETDKFNFRIYIAQRL